MKILWLLIVAAFVCFVAFGPHTRAAQEIARFQCNDTHCITTLVEYENIERIFQLMVEKIVELQNKSGCT